jgi:ABC-type transport system substrate-binding protein
MGVPLVPKHLLVNSADINIDEFNSSRPIGTGPYVFKEWLPDDHLTLAANPTYWGGKPKIGQWIRKVTKDSNVTTAQLKTGELDYAAAQPDALDDLRQANLNILSYPGPNINYIAYNLDRPLFQDKRVRQALTHALDRATIVKILLLDEAQVLNSAGRAFVGLQRGRAKLCLRSGQGARPTGGGRLVARPGWSAPERRHFLSLFARYCRWHQSARIVAHDRPGSVGQGWGAGATAVGAVRCIY